VNGSDFAVPEADHELKLAYHLLGRESGLDLAILESLLGTPRRFRDLKPLVKGSSDTPLTRALRRLGENGLVRQGMNLDDPGDPRYYAATRLGVHVALKAHEMRPVTEVLAEMRGAGLRVA
jgi:DNA-binding HxlR family transcriptional regulator